MHYSSSVLVIMLFHASFRTNLFVIGSRSQDVDVLGLDRKRTVTPQTGTCIIIVRLCTINVCFDVKFWLCSCRNLSSTDEEEERILMRSCPRLIDSLMTYVQTQMERGDPDDKVIMLIFLLHALQALTLHGKICGHWNPMLEAQGSLWFAL